MSTAPSATGTDQADAVEAVRAVIEAYADGMRASDVARIVDLFTNEAAVMTPDMPTAVGHDHLTRVYRGALDAVAMDFHFEFDEVKVRGDTAVVRTRTTGHNTVKATGQEVPGKYRELFVLQRHDGSWKIAHYMFQPMPQQS